MTWEFLDPRMTMDRLGLIPHFLSESNPRSATEQLDAGYAHGGGWSPFKGFSLTADNSLIYPGDPPMKPQAQTRLRNELIVLYPHAWVAVIQPDRSFEVCRMD